MTKRKSEIMLEPVKPREDESHHARALLAQVGHVVYFGNELDQIIEIKAGGFGGPYFLLFNYGLVCYSVVTFPAEIGF